MSKLDYLRRNAKINDARDETIADTFFDHKDAPGLYQMVPIDRIDPDPGNPRQSMDPVRLQQLADSIREKGIIHPLNLIELETGRYRVEEGHRRHAAAQIAGLRSVPAIIKAGADLSAEEVLERQLVENLHNELLPPIDSARAIRKLMNDHRLSVREVARKISLPRSTVDEYLAIDGFGEEGRGPEVRGLDRFGYSCLSAHDDDGHHRVVTVDLAQQPYPIDIAHDQVADHEIGTPGFDGGQCHLSAFRAGHLKALKRQPAFDKGKV